MPRLVPVIITNPSSLRDRATFVADIPRPNGYYCQLTHAGQNYAARKVEKSLLMQPTRLVCADG